MGGVSPADLCQDDVRLLRGRDDYDHDYNHHDHHSNDDNHHYDSHYDYDDNNNDHYHCHYHDDDNEHNFEQQRWRRDTCVPIRRCPDRPFRGAGTVRLSGGQEVRSQRTAGPWPVSLALS